MMTAELGLVGEAVTLSRGGRRVLVDVSMSVEPGQVTAVVGPNGSGKSSLMAALCGDLPLTSGTVRLNGRELHQWSDRDQAWRRAVMLQESLLAFDLPVMTVVGLGLAMSGGGDPSLDPELHSAVQTALADVGLAAMAARPYTALSGGERQRVHLARALLQCRYAIQPGCLLLDEPTASLDLKYQHRLLRLARAEARRGAAVMLILHDLNQVTAVADRVLLLADGRTRYWGDTRGLFDCDLLSAAYDVPIQIIEDPVGRPVLLAR